MAYSHSGQPRPMASLVILLLLALYQVLAAAEYSSMRSRCPQTCSELGDDPASWTYYHSLHVLNRCNETVLFDTNLFNAVNDTDTHLTMRACSLGADLSALAGAKRAHVGRSALQGDETADTVRPAALSWGTIITSSGNGSTASLSAESTAVVDELVAYAESNADGVSGMFSARENTVAAVYIGAGVQTASAVDVLGAFADAVANAKAPRVAVQYCGNASLTTDQAVFGVILDTKKGSVARVQEALAKWADGTCLQGDGVSPTSTWWSTTSAPELVLEDDDSAAAKLRRRADDTPEPSDDGTCYTYVVSTGDTCSSIALAYDIDVTAIEDNNDNTWGWMGCSDLQIGQYICLSTGTPPFPATQSNAVCGPQVNDTTPTTNYTGWSDLNPCPINACCDIWGQCGITSDFCTPNPADTGSPGTAQPGSNGCISNCGFAVIESVAPDSFSTVGYFEAWNKDRPCLHMDPKDIPSKYTHVHFAFGNITDDYAVDVSGYQEMFDNFVAGTSYKRILSFGGWTFSTSPETYPIFREGVTEAERQTFADNVVAFIKENDLDGVDFDWEYPGATDIPGIPAGTADDATNYLAFLQDMRARLPTDEYTLSIAAPASYWYLRNFPIQEIGEVVDYIIYMTYDLHGQWDYGNSYSDPGCDEGNCLRSQVNKTETLSALSMITKAGVPSNKIMVGQAMYGRSFEMTEAGCYTEMCTYVGPDSGATPGMCTDTAGYISNWEISQILITSDLDADQYYSDEAGDIVVYNETQWVSYLSSNTYDSRVSWVEGMNFAGTSDWAMDLDASYYDNGTKVTNGSGVVYIDPSVLTDFDATIACIPPCTFVLPPWTLSTMTTISQPPVTETIDELWTSTSTGENGSPTVVYITSTTVTTITIPELTTDTISIYNVIWTDVSDTIIYFTSSVDMPSTVLEEADDTVTTGSTTTVLPGVIYTYIPGPYSGAPVTSTTSYPPDPPPTPPPGLVGSVVAHSGTPSPTCVLGCGSLCLLNCLPSIPCIGICGCVGIGCPTNSEGENCMGAGCVEDDGEGDDDSSTTTSCATSHTVTNCEVPCTVTNYGSSTSSTCNSQTCDPTLGCDTTGKTTTSWTTTSDCVWTGSSYVANTWTIDDPAGDPPQLGAGGIFGFYGDGGTVYTSATDSPSATSYIPCTYQGQDPDQGITARYCVCSGSTFAPKKASTGANSCAYTTMPTETISADVLYVTTTTNCAACTYAGLSKVGCTDVGGCTRTVTSTRTFTETTTITKSVVPAASGTADCSYVNEIFFWRFEVFNIDNWADDEGAALKKEEGGCGALTGWSWHEGTDGDPSYVYFNLPFLIADGCVERAIVSAGGPKISCTDNDVYPFRRGLDSGYEEDEVDEESEADRAVVEVVQIFEVIEQDNWRDHKEAEATDLLLWARSVARMTASFGSLTSTPTYSYSETTSFPPYIPMTWTDNSSTVIMTWTLTEVTSDLVTSFTVLPGGTTTIPATTTGISTPSPIQTGMVGNCDDFYLVVSGDTCSGIADEAGISLDDFYAWNPAVGTSCASLGLGDYVCIGITGSSSATSTTSVTSTGNGVSTPSPIQTGMVTNCDDFYLVVSGDTCSAIAADAGISLTTFYEWNPAVGSSCASLGLGDYVCIGILSSSTTVLSTTTSTSSGNGVTTPTPFEPDMVTDCDTFHYVVSGDSCASIASAAGITVDDFYTWNPEVGTSCTSLWLGYYVCIGVL